MQRWMGLLQVLLLLTLSINIATVLAATPTSFCKCTCFTNSTIIELRPVDTSRGTDDNLRERSIFDRAGSGDTSSHGRALTCNDCTRKFCLGYNLPICEKADEKDVLTTCFKRDSRKDETVVFIFIFATAGLLTWAAVKPWAERWIEAARDRRSYIPVSNQNTNQ
ncbi:hypothetical protein BGW36DRAFT_60285 [Talaromyces proteolyticus]|uniref:Uncharacterized protein n=1 Tax=Talaromyces proteolyticus TaxID=1131652 RepID=A0AAD4KF57_9EURO|nr:uncharacterized protein BGW36DRAFT_60285 [Talaromyces proteolyticus]KAH8690824.1 hypothetical protein BGW36DRAFT_60285 [Talaromyces proteolyticus]